MMTLTFVTNLVHHHQLPVADEFYRLLGENYRYIATKELPDWLIKGGYDSSIDRPYIIRAYESEDAMKLSRKLIDESDVIIHGAAPVEWSYKRLTENKVTFFYSERWLKKVDLRSFAPRRLLSIYRYYFRFRHRRSYMLCASAFTASDVHLFGCFPDRCFKWGYLTKVDNTFDIEDSPMCSDNVPIMWCARFLKLKHPELPVQLASSLKEKGYKITLDMYGSGEELERIMRLIEKLEVSDCVNLCGNLPNEEILNVMRKHQIFLFTSDRNEGWGAVLNESMSNGCVPVVSNEIGSVPYLIKDGVNGVVFHSGSLKALEEAVIPLLDNSSKRYNMRKAALSTMQNVWSPRIAASNFLDLANHAINNKLNEYNRKEGPASWHK